MAKRAGRRFQTDGLSPRPKIASIIKGRIQSEGEFSRAKSNPLAESFRPAQLTCSQGRKKQRRINPAKLKVRLLEFFTRFILGDAPLFLAAFGRLKSHLLTPRNLIGIPECGNPPSINVVPSYL
jgi:hypothetical protein